MPEPSHTPQRAAWGYRVGAFLIDVSAAVIGGLGLYLALLADGTVSDDDASAYAGLAMIGLWVLVTAGLSGRTGGQSLGKWIAGIRVFRNGRPAGFGRVFVRDFLCALLYAVPFVFLVDALMPLGRERLSLRDRMASTEVVMTESARRRIPVLIACALIGIGAYVALAVAVDDQTRRYTREEFVSDCMSGGGSSLGCGCIYDKLEENVSRGDLDAMRTAERADDVFVGAQNVLDAAVRACRPA